MVAHFGTFVSNYFLEARSFIYLFIQSMQAADEFLMLLFKHDISAATGPNFIGRSVKIHEECFQNHFDALLTFQHPKKGSRGAWTFRVEQIFVVVVIFVKKT